MPAPSDASAAAPDAGGDPPPPPPVDKKLVVSLSQETLTAYENDVPVLVTPVTTGGPRTVTPLGTFHVLAKITGFTMHSPWPNTDWRWYADSFVNYGLLFESSGYFVHDAPWRQNFGPGSDSVFGTPGGNFTGTHGCVNVPLDAEAKIYPWAPIGMPVIIQP